MLASMVALVAVGLVLGLDRVRTGPDLPAGTAAVPGLRAEVEVLWDSLGIPHIFAGTIEDAYRAQGMVHARDRLWQMEFFRRVAAGRLSEVLGEATLDSDRFLRTLGMGRVAERAVGTLDSETREYLEAYTEGVNHAIEHWRGPLPPEFLVLRFRPEPFTIEDALAIERIMAWDLTSYGKDLNEASLIAALPPELYARVRTADPPGGTTILGGLRGLGSPTEPAHGAGASMEPEVSPPASALSGSLPQLLAAARAPEALPPLLNAASASRASNAWVVGGERSASGSPLVANDMHLALNRPTLFYLVGLHAPGLDVVGMSIPGAPSVVAGRSGAVAWGYTNANVDDTDFYLEQVDPTDTTRYMTPEGSEPFRQRVEVIRVSGRDLPDTLVVRETRHGPIMTPVEARLGGELVALRWVAHDDSSSVPAVMKMNRAEGVEEFIEALRGFRTLHQNVVFADTAGRWGYWMAGRVPLRGTARPPVGVLQGWTGEGDWQGYLPFDEHPHAREPEAGFVVTANNRQSADSIGDLISPGLWAPPYRAEQITRLVEGSAQHDVASMHAIQLDVVTLRGVRFRQDAAEGFREAGLNDVADLLEVWDGEASIDRIEPTLFQGWYDGVRRALGREVWGPGGGSVGAPAVDRWIAEGLPEGVSAAAAGEAMDGTGAVPWGDLHTLRLDHPLSAVPILQRLFGFARSGIPIPGTGETVRVASYSRTGEGLVVTHGASQRHISDMGEPAGHFILPGGQSGYPASPHADDQLTGWLGGELVALPLTRSSFEQVPHRRWLLVPSAN